MNSIEILSRHVAQTLPDSIDERRRLLVALTHVLKASHAAYSSVQKQIQAIDDLKKLQAELPLQFSNGGAR